MSASVVETRLVTGFTRVSLCAQHRNELIITQGDREALTIEGPPDLVPRLVAEVRHGTLVLGTGGGWLEKVTDALTTSLNRPQVRYLLSIKDLESIEVSAMASVRAATLRARELLVKFRGVGELHIDSLLADHVEVVQSGVCRVELAGHAARQRVSLSGPARYHAPELESHAAQVTVRGMGVAVVWATRELAAVIRGPGQVSYYGAPRLSGSVAPLGSLVSLGGRRQPTEVPEATASPAG